MTAHVAMQIKKKNFFSINTAFFFFTQMFIINLRGNNFTIVQSLTYSAHRCAIYTFLKAS